MGTMCAVFGVLVIGLPIPIIGSSFNNFYAREKRREKLTLERAKQEAAVSMTRSESELKYFLSELKYFLSELRYFLSELKYFLSEPSL